MYHLMVIVLGLILGGICLYVSAKFLKRFTWVLEWVRGTLGLVFLAIAVLVGIAALDLVSYRELLRDKPVATLTFEKKAEQVYSVEVDFILDGVKQSYELHGDQWQMDARIIRWNGVFASVGAKPGFKLDRLSGRYYSLEDERRKQRTVHEMASAKYGVDVWSLLHRHGWIPFIEASYGSATYLPMADKAIFRLSLSNTGLVSEPVNDEAKKAVKDWR